MQISLYCASREHSEAKSPPLSLAALLLLGSVACTPVVDEAVSQPSSHDPAALVTLPDFTIHPLPEEGPLSVFRPDMAKYTEVFGVHIVASRKTKDKKIHHAARVLAEWLDNNEDGTPDNPMVLKALQEGGAFLIMVSQERDMRRLDLEFEVVEEAGFFIGQDLYGEETLPKNPPHVQERGRFDATIEEVLHLVSNGYTEVYPSAFDWEGDSLLMQAMVKARGGDFDRPPRRYPKEAWYHYDDPTCDSNCQAGEYFYWVLTTLLGGQDYPGRAKEIANEWELTTPEALKEGDPDAYRLFTDPQYGLPTVLPDGHYAPVDA